MFWHPDMAPEIVAIAVGCFADPTFPAPKGAIWAAHRVAPFWLGFSFPNGAGVLLRWDSGDESPGLLATAPEPWRARVSPPCRGFLLPTLLPPRPPTYNFPGDVRFNTPGDKRRTSPSPAVVAGLCFSQTAGLLEAAFPRQQQQFTEEIWRSAARLESFQLVLRRLANPRLLGKKLELWSDRCWFGLGPGLLLLPLTVSVIRRTRSAAKVQKY